MTRDEVRDKIQEIIAQWDREDRKTTSIIVAMSTTLETGDIDYLVEVDAGCVRCSLLNIGETLLEMAEGEECEEVKDRNATKH